MTSAASSLPVQDRVLYATMASQSEGQLTAMWKLVFRKVNAVVSECLLEKASFRMGEQLQLGHQLVCCQHVGGRHPNTDAGRSGKRAQADSAANTTNLWQSNRSMLSCQTRLHGSDGDCNQWNSFTVRCDTADRGAQDNAVEKIMCYKQCCEPHDTERFAVKNVIFESSLKMHHCTHN